MIESGSNRDKIEMTDRFLPADHRRRVQASTVPLAGFESARSIRERTDGVCRRRPAVEPGRRSLTSASHSITPRVVLTSATELCVSPDQSNRPHRARLLAASVVVDEEQE
uniref:Uncharacterized protein n=1 Tax=Plectus sambesii TaxID=2011161 RepID=A0A914VZQ1_9BILA